MHRSKLLACASAASLIAGGGVAFASAANPAVHDVAGDAQNSRRQNVPAVDILSADLTTNGTTLVYREDFAGKPTLSGPVIYDQTVYTQPSEHGFGEPGLDLHNHFADGSAAFTAGYEPPPNDCDCSGTPAVTVPGTAVVSGNSIVATYSLAEINRQFAAKGFAPIKAGTTYYDAAAYARNETPQNALDRLQAQNNAKNAGDYANTRPFDRDTYTYGHTSFVLGGA